MRAEPVEAYLHALRQAQGASNKLRAHPIWRTVSTSAWVAMEWTEKAELVEGEQCLQMSSS